jgi:cell division septum initiation protein DivIVA
MEQYLVYRNQQVTAYYNSPQYRLQMLQEQIEDLNSNITELKEEVQAKNDEIDELNESLYQAKTFIWALGFVSICLLLFILRKNFTFLFEKLTH